LPTDPALDAIPLEGELESSALTSGPCVEQDVWPAVKIMLRADGIAGEEGLMAWRETNHVDVVIGSARNSRLLAELSSGTT